MSRKLNTNKTNLQRRLFLQHSWVTPTLVSVSLPLHAQTSELVTPTPVPAACTPADMDLSTTIEYVDFVVAAVANNTTRMYEIDVRVTVTNSNSEAVSNVAVQLSFNGDDVGQMNLISGDSNNNSVLEPGETWVYQLVQDFSFTAAGGMSVPPQPSMTATVSATDDCDEPVTGSASQSIRVVIFNMAIYANQETISPGDEVEVTLVSRLEADDIEDVLWDDFAYKCNLLGDSWRNGGPEDQYWSRHQVDLMNKRLGTTEIILDKNDDNYHSEYSSWVHKFTYKVPTDITTDLVIDAEDKGVLRAFSDGEWQLLNASINAKDQLILPIRIN